MDASIYGRRKQRRTRLGGARLICTEGAASSESQCRPLPYATLLQPRIGALTLRATGQRASAIPHLLCSVRVAEFLCAVRAPRLPCCRGAHLMVSSCPPPTARPRPGCGQCTICFKGSARRLAQSVPPSSCGSTSPTIAMLSPLTIYSPSGTCGAYTTLKSA